MRNLGRLESWSDVFNRNQILVFPKTSTSCVTPSDYNCWNKPHPQNYPEFVPSSHNHYYHPLHQKVLQVTRQIHPESAILSTFSVTILVLASHLLDCNTAFPTGLPAPLASLNHFSTWQNDL